MDFETDRAAEGFSSVRGHEAVIDRLRRAIATHRVPHAYLFSGPDGVGKATTGLALAQALNCHAEPGMGCGRCAVCDRMRRGIHPDLLWVIAEGKQIRIDQIRRLEERLAQGAYESQAMVVIFDEAERLNVNSANALLKSLEEPRAGVHFVLVSAAAHRVPLTIRSRCQLVRFAPLPVDELSGLLVARFGIDAEQADQVARVSEGSTARALQYLDSEHFPIWRGWVDRLANLGRQAQPDVPTLTGQLFQEVDDLEALLKLLLPRLRDQWLVAARGDAEGARLVLLSPGDEEYLWARAVPALVLERRIRAVQSGLRDLGKYVNKSLALERVLLQLGQ